MPGLDGLRTIAVTCVFLHHSIAPPGNFGSLGVWIFFVLSGFLVLPIAWKSVERRTSDHWKERLVRTGHFSANRFLRIFPIYYALLAFLGVLALLGIEHKPIPGYVAGAPYFWTYTTNFYIAAKGEFIDVFTHLWSLAVEFQFYVLVGVMILIAPRGMFRTLLRGAFLVCLIYSAQLIILRDTVGVYVNSLVGFTMMLLGGLTAMLLDNPRFFERVRRHASPLAAVVAVVGVHVTLICFGFYRATYFVTPLLSAVAIAMVVAKPEATAFLEWSPIRAMGAMSYGFYLYHLFVIAVSREVFTLIAGRLNLPVLETLYAPVAFAGTLLISWCSWHFFEKKILAHKFRDRGIVAGRESGLPAMAVQGATPDSGA